MTTEELVMLHYDGELDSAGTREVERLLARDPRARQLLQQLEQVGSLVREADAARAQDLDLAPEILKRVFDPGASAGGRMSVPARREAARFGRPVVWLAGTLALAAGLSLVLRPEPPRETAGLAPKAPVVEVTPPSASIPPREMERAEQAVAVESVDFGSKQGAIFLVPSSETGMLVVWMLEDASDAAREIDL